MRESSEDARARRDRLIQLLAEPLRTAGFGVGLGGSVLTKGSSDKDLDLIVFPLNASDFSLDAARGTFLVAGMQLLWNRYEIARFWSDAGSSDTKHVEVWAYENRRVDVFFLS
jgi:hypothetical protein